MITFIVFVLVAGTLYYLVKTANDFYQKEEELDNIVTKRYVDNILNEKYLDKEKRVIDKYTEYLDKGSKPKYNDRYERALDNTGSLAAGYILGSILNSKDSEPVVSSSVFKEVTEAVIDSFSGGGGSSAGAGATSSWDSDGSSDSGSSGGD